MVAFRVSMKGMIPKGRILHITWLDIFMHLASREFEQLMFRKIVQDLQKMYRKRTNVQCFAGCQTYKRSDQTGHRQPSGAWNLIYQHPLQVLATLNEPQIDKQLYGPNIFKETHILHLLNPYVISYNKSSISIQDIASLHHHLCQHWPNVCHSVAHQAILACLHHLALAIAAATPKHNASDQPCYSPTMQRVVWLPDFSWDKCALKKVDTKRLGGW